MKIFYIASGFIALLLIGFIIPPYIIISGTPEVVLFEWHMGGQSESVSKFFIASKIIPNQNNQYPNHCKESEQVLIQTYGWMMIPRSVVEYCVYSRNNYGEITETRSMGIIKKSK